MSKELVEMGQQFTGLPMRELIGVPLMAAAKANNQMAATQTKFLLDTCFKREEENQVETYEPIMVRMKLTRPVIIPPEEEGKPPEVRSAESIIEIPILTIIPLNSLGVDNVTVAFHMEVKSSYSEGTNESASESLEEGATFSAKVGGGWFSAEISGNVSYNSSSESSRETHYEMSNSSEYDVSVHAGQLPLPQGVTTIINAYAKAIAPIEVSYPS